MQLDFYTTYQSFTKEELFEIILNAGDYQPEAVQAARRLIREKNYTGALNQLLEQQKQKEAEEQAEIERDTLDAAAQHKQLGAYLKENSEVHIRMGDTPKLEAALSKKGIGYHKRYKNIENETDVPAAQTYYFTLDDLDDVYAIMKELNIAAYVKPLWRFGLLVLVVVIISIMLGYLLHK